jgi:hypothetical protein
MLQRKSSPTTVSAAPSPFDHSSTRSVWGSWVAHIQNANVDPSVRFTVFRPDPVVAVILRFFLRDFVY